MAATTEQQTVMLEEVTLQENEEIVTVVEAHEVEGEDVSEDILQQALVEATDGFDESEVTYTTENTTVVSDGTMPVKVGTVLGNETYTVVGSVDESNNFVPAEPQPGTSLLKPNVLQQHIVTDDVQTTSQETPITVTVSNATGHPVPLGSSANPIRIVQQGNQYTSLQQLTPEQLSQIMQVVQEQQVSKVTSEGGGSSTIFNPQTQTRIVYRVIYPSELHKKGEEVKSHVLIGSNGQPLTIQQTFGKRSYRKRNREEEDKVDGPELSREEKEERKKKRPRTRSGRVSRPPKHMVKDYKHIHPLDWDEDYDDSDGGYSDFKQSDEEAGEVGEDGERPRKKDFVYVQPGGSTLKKKNWKCETCAKAYIGKAGLSRHFSLNPAHGHLEEDQPPDDTLRNTAGQNGDLSEDSNTQDSISPQSSASLTSLTNSQSVTSIVPTTAPTPVTTTASPRIPKGALKMKQSYLQENTPTRRRARLKDFVRQCEDEELMEIVLPRLAKVITVWEFLLMKVEKGKPLKPHFTDVFKEFEALHKKVKKMCGEHLKPATDASQNNKFQLTDDSMASSLGLKVGAYDILQTPQEEPPEQRQYKLLTTGHGQLIGETQFTKRTVQVVSPNQLVAVSPIKKPIIEISPIDQSSQDNRQLASSVSVQESVSPTTPLENGVNQKQSNTTQIIVTNGNANTNPPQQTLLTNGNGFVPLKEEAVEIQNKQNTIVITKTEDINTGVEPQQEAQMETQGTHVLHQVEGQIMHEINGDTHVYVQEGEVIETMTSEQDMEQVGEETQTVYQPTNGIYLIQNPDGTFQVHGNSDQTIPLETVQALLANAMDSDTQIQIEQTEEIDQS